METKLLKKREKKREQKEYNCLQKGSYLTLHDQIWKIFSCLYDAKNGELFLSVRTKHIEIPNTFLNLVSAANTAHTHTCTCKMCVLDHLLRGCVMCSTLYLCRDGNAVVCVFIDFKRSSCMRASARMCEYSFSF